MRYRLATLLAEKALPDAGTEIISVNVQKPISRIDIRFEVYRVVATGIMSAHQAADITKIELVDGSDVLFSLNGYECQALNIYDRKCGGRQMGDHLAGCWSVSLYSIDFGRYLWDPELAFDPTKFNNPQLKITYTLTSMDAEGTDGKLEVFAECFDEKVISPIGFLMSKEHKSYTVGSSSSYEYTQLPTDYPIRKMLVRAYRDGYEPWNAITEVKLDEDNEARVPILVNVEDYIWRMRGVWTPVEEFFLFYAYTIEKPFYVTPTTYIYDMHFMCLSGGMGDITANTYRGGKIDLRADVNGTISGGVTGYLPNHCIEFPFGLQNDLDDWYDVTRLGSLRLRLKAGGVGDTCTGQVVLQQLRRY